MRTKVELTKYINDMKYALRYPGSKHLYFPADKDDRKQGNIRLARELGYGLKDFDPIDVDEITGTLYGSIIVINSFDSIGVQIDNKTFIYHLNLARQS